MICVQPTSHLHPHTSHTPNQWHKAALITALFLAAAGPCAASIDHWTELADVPDSMFSRAEKCLLIEEGKDKVLSTVDEILKGFVLVHASHTEQVRLNLSDLSQQYGVQNCTRKSFKRSDACHALATESQAQRNMLLHAKMDLDELDKFVGNMTALDAVYKDKNCQANDSLDQCGLIEQAMDQTRDDLLSKIAAGTMTLPLSNAKEKRTDVFAAHLTQRWFRGHRQAAERLKCEQLRKACMYHPSKNDCYKQNFR